MEGGAWWATVHGSQRVRHDWATSLSLSLSREISVSVTVVIIYILVIRCKETTHWESPGCRERLRAEGEEGVRGWDGWTASLMQWTWTWANSGRWWGTGRPDMLQSMGFQRLGYDWATEQQQPVQRHSHSSYFKGHGGLHLVQLRTSGERGRVLNLPPW